ncbi:MAG: hypothetical protein OYL92_12040 [Acidobacteriota bacterium]|nr:hypothetical protein [Acidobacteriota bacterium]MDE3265690.1 hypothetical protein [Acidobacteriota bacterium]
MTAVALDDVARVLEIYVEAMLARPAEVRPLADLRAGDRSRAGHLDLEGAAAAGRPTTDGAAFYLPERIDRLPDSYGNFMVYRMAVLHQLGGVLFGTYRRGPLRFADFFAGFDEPGLARALFARLEGARIDAALARVFRGVGRDLLRLIDDALETSLSPPSRPPVRRQPREAALFDLARALLVEQRSRLEVAPTDEDSASRIPAQFEEAATLLNPGATVDHTLRAVQALYPELAGLRSVRSSSEPAPAANGGRPRDPGAAPDSEAEVQSLDVPAPAHHGDPAPERVELRREWQELASEVEVRDDVEPGPIAAGLMEQLQVDELGVLSLQDGDLSGTAGLPLTDLDITGAIEAEGGDEEGTPIELDPDELAARLEELSKRLERELAEAGLDREQVYYYDEWDHELAGYRRRWCHLREKVIEPPGTAPNEAAAPAGRFVDETRRHHADLLRRVRKQFELLKPEEFRRMRRLIEGEELDLDRVVESHVDRRAGRPPDGAVYMSRRRQHRDVAAAFLLDMSASTDAEAPVDEPEPASGREPEPEYVGVFDDFDWPDNPQPLPPGRRVIDIEKESLVLMADALETLGDDYAIYGFSGFGRKEVEFFVAKEFDDDFDRGAEDRIAAMEPKRSTRMGPAIRHAAARLAEREAKVKVLLILSDGYPQDFDYGSDRASRVYGIRDTMVALRETERQGISTFCITVDPAGHDYLREMCPERRYLVIDEIAALPSQLPKVYRGLTA